MKARAEAADMALLDEGQTTCCYARSEKHWVTDPQGIAWEHFHTLGNIPVFSESSAQRPRLQPAVPDRLRSRPGRRLLRPGRASACCAPA
jgi:hypothetical protein